MFFNKKKDLENKKKILQATKEQMGVNHGYTESNYQNKMMELMKIFRESDDIEVKEDIANQIIALRGELPTEIQMELNSLKGHRKR